MGFLATNTHHGKQLHISTNDCNIYTAYQVNFSDESKGKALPSSKRHITWSFGFSDMNELYAGNTGESCRGEEHEVSFYWSVASGKRIILLDGAEIHYSAKPFDRKFNFEWKTKGGTKMKIVSEGASNIQLVLNDHSYFDLPQIDDLGVTRAGGALIDSETGTSKSSFDTPSFRDTMTITSTPSLDFSMVSVSVPGQNFSERNYDAIIEATYSKETSEDKGENRNESQYLSKSDVGRLDESLAVLKMKFIESKEKCREKASSCFKSCSTCFKSNEKYREKIGEKVHEGVVVCTTCIRRVSERSRY